MFKDVVYSPPHELDLRLCDLDNSDGPAGDAGISCLSYLAMTLSFSKNDAVRFAIPVAVFSSILVSCFQISLGTILSWGLDLESTHGLPIVGPIANGYSYSVAKLNSLILQLLRFLGCQNRNFRKQI